MVASKCLYVSSFLQQEERDAALQTPPPPATFASFYNIFAAKHFWKK